MADICKKEKKKVRGTGVARYLYADTAGMSPLSRHVSPISGPEADCIPVEMSRKPRPGFLPVWVVLLGRLRA